MNETVNEYGLDEAEMAEGETVAMALHGVIGQLIDKGLPLDAIGGVLAGEIGLLLRAAVEAGVLPPEGALGLLDDMRDFVLAGVPTVGGVN